MPWLALQRLPKMTCIVCGKEFKRTHYNQKICGKNCRRIRWHEQNLAYESQPKVKARKREYCAQHKEEMVARSSKWRKDNPEDAKRHDARNNEKKRLKRQLEAL
jgi:sRNA-binding protein